MEKKTTTNKTKTISKIQMYRRVRRQILPSEFKTVMNKVPISISLYLVNLNDLKKFTKYKKVPNRNDYKFIQQVKAHGIGIKEQKGLYLFVDFIIGSDKPNANEMCTFLQDGKCSIYNNQPTKCKLLPIQPLISESMMGEGMEAMKTRCEGFTPNSNLSENTIWEDGEIISPIDEMLIEHYFQELGRTSDLIYNKLEREGNFRNTIKDFFTRFFYTKQSSCSFSL